MVNNLFSDIPHDISEELFTTLISTKHIKLERIVSQGQSTPPGKWLVGNKAEWVILIKGSAKLLFRYGPRLAKLKPGDYVHIPARCAHRVEYTHPKQKTVWLALYY
jgi:cupin 2 domain-containing protein